MNRFTVTRTIDAPIEAVFKTGADIAEFSKALPHVVKYEFLSNRHSEVGTRFRETRLMNGKEETTELEVTEYVANDRVRIVAASHGTIWDTMFTVEAENENTIPDHDYGCESLQAVAQAYEPARQGYDQ